MLDYGALDETRSADQVIDTKELMNPQNQCLCKYFIFCSLCYGLIVFELYSLFMSKAKFGILLLPVTMEQGIVGAQRMLHSQS